MEFIAAVAVGLNPYVGTFVLAGLLAFTTRVPQSELADVVPGALLALATVAAGIAMPIDFVLGKFVRFAPQVRRLSQSLAPLAGALLATLVAQSDLPRAAIAAGAAFISWAVAAMVTDTAARGSRSHAWVGLGHIPVLMSAATAAACMIPLGVAKLGIGLSLALLALATLLWSTWLGRRSSVQTPLETPRRAVALSAPGHAGRMIAR